MVLSEDGLGHEWYYDNTVKPHQVVDELDEANITTLKDIIFKEIGDKELSLEDYDSDFFSELSEEQGTEGYFRLRAQDLEGLVKDEGAFNELCKNDLDELGSNLRSLYWQSEDSAYEDELYLTPEEQIKREAKNIQQNSYQLLQNEVNKRESKELLAEFLEDTSHSEDLIVEHQQEFINFYNQELVKNGVQDYYPLKTRRKALETAYKKIEILQPDYENKIREKILKELNEQKKEKFEDAKKQQRISKPVANANKPMTYEEEQRALIRKYL